MPNGCVPRQKKVNYKAVEEQEWFSTKESRGGGGGSFSREHES